MIARQSGGPNRTGQLAGRNFDRSYILFATQGPAIRHLFASINRHAPETRSHHL